VDDDNFPDDPPDGFVGGGGGGGGGTRRSRGAGSSASSLAFGMVALTYDDVVHRSSSTSSSSSSSSTRTRRGGSATGDGVPPRSSPTSGRQAQDGVAGVVVPRAYDDGMNYDEDDEEEGDDVDEELLDLERRHLSNLRDPNSSHRAVAYATLVLHQLAYTAAGGCGGGNDCRASPQSRRGGGSSSYVESSILHNADRHRRFVRRALPSLTRCATTHTSSKCRILASCALASVARANYCARDRFDRRLDGVCVPPSIATSIEDACGDGCARSLVASAIDDVDDGVSSYALSNLGRLTMDVRSDDGLSSEIRSIAECANPTNMLTYDGRDASMMGSSSSSSTFIRLSTMRAMQSRIWENVVFPRMGIILHRLSLYDDVHRIELASPIVTAVLVHALTRGRETAPSRRAILTNKVAHGKRGWREVDAMGRAGEYVEGILLPRLRDANICGGGYAFATALVRMSSACPNAPWRISACRHATAVFLRRLEEGMTSSSTSRRAPSTLSSSSSSYDASRGLPSFAVMSSSVPIETLAGTAAMLLVAMRGIPPRERVPGLTATLRAALLYVPCGVPVHGGDASTDLPVCKVRDIDGRRGHCRLGRIGLLAEVALSLFLDGATTRDDRIIGGNGPGAVLLRRVLQSDSLAPFWEWSRYERESTAYRPVDELLWVFCSVATRVGKGPSVVDAADWCDLSLVLLDTFAGFVCDPGVSRSSASSPFALAGHAAYIGLFVDVLQRCGSSPPSTLSISKNMMPPPSSSEAAPVDVMSPVVGGPGKQLDHVASNLTKITTKILFQRSRDKSKYAAAKADVTSVEDIFDITSLIAVLVDAWLGRCIMNHDAKLSNDDLLDMGIMFFPLLSTIMLQLLNCHGANFRDENVDVVSQLSRVLIASFENIACMSELLAHTSSRIAKEGVAVSDVGPLAISILGTLVSSAEEPSKQSSVIRHQIVHDAQYAIYRISKCIHHMPQSYPEDIASSFQVSSLIGDAILRPLLPRPETHGQWKRCSRFLYNHARLVLIHRTNTAIRALTPTLSSPGIGKLVRPRNPLRLTSSFSHSKIEMYQKARDLPLLIPVRDYHRNDAETLTGCSDPVSLTLTHGVQRVLRGDSTEGLSFVITMRLYNITPVPIRRGVCLGLKISHRNTPGKRVMLGDGPSFAVTSPYKHEISAGDSITWEVTLMNWRVGDLVVQTDITFLDIDKESTTHRWVTAGGPIDEDAVPIEAMDDDDEASMDVTLPCKTISISTVEGLIPCPLVYFLGCDQCAPNMGQGDVASFEYLWNCMEKWRRTLPFIIPNGQMEGKAVATLSDTRIGYVNLASSVTSGDDNGMGGLTGCAFLAPDGSRICCIHQARGGDAHVLKVRSDSSVLLESIAGTSYSQTAFIRFIFGSSASVLNDAQGE
jgi:hypothetical protein